MNVNIDQIIEIFCALDDYYLEISSQLDKIALSRTGYRERKPKMSYSEVMSILVIFHLSGTRNLKHFYLNYVCKHLRQEFPDPISYNRFVPAFIHKRNVAKNFQENRRFNCKNNLILYVNRHARSQIIR